eukprot:CAMPEP_0172913562 /NCGR_PEP_ID=MMETSP1075-20121228/190625_1 /TAXON_ID=2916 /ORGANISM="Ceratium fusus, Strain PA161109" /LENGTH=163 /DNA_ID=CAMNT_0013772297 /DNA_START=149 /DNA_END=637 /DNA_ORIENTATION=-
MFKPGVYVKSAEQFHSEDPQPCSSQVTIYVSDDENENGENSQEDTEDLETETVPATSSVVTQAVVGTSDAIDETRNNLDDAIPLQDVSSWAPVSTDPYACEGEMLEACEGTDVAALHHSDLEACEDTVVVAVHNLDATHNVEATEDSQPPLPGVVVVELGADD